MKGEKLLLVLSVLDDSPDGMTIDALTTGDLLTTKDVGNAKNFGHVERVQRKDGHHVYRITRDGRSKLEELRQRKAAEEAGLTVDERTPEAEVSEQRPQGGDRRAAPAGSDPVELPVREVDIDAAHRTLHGTPPAPPIRSASEVLAMLPPDAAPGPVRSRPARSRVTTGPEFRCALFSDGVLYVRSGDTELELPVEHTRALMHYLEHTLQAAATLAAGGEHA
ncbi:MAG: hypothetical protein KIT60_06875 [Burkholderiaceae bacterium]|nr:hypothetical protein [Burkholderiaceae bacterium]